MKISIIVPIFNKIEVVERCLELNMLHCTQPQHWIVIDNGSDLPTKQGLLRLQQKAAERGHSFKLITESTNTGVAVAWNTGLRFADLPYVCILNNDCVLMPGWDESLIELICKEELSIITPFVVEPWMFKHAYTLDDFLSGTRNWQFLKKRNAHRFKKGMFGGVVFFGEKKSFETVGPFDETFWLSLEEYDYLIRAQNLGLKTGTTGDCVGFHYAGLTRNQMKTDGGIANQTYFQKKWGWHFETQESMFFNKYIKSWQKLLFRHFYTMSTINLIWPNGK